MQVFTLVSRGDTRRYEIVLGDTPIIVGRSPENDVVIDDAQISRHHARIEAHDGLTWISDLESKNGTWLNGTRVTTVSVELRFGDQVRFAELDFGVQSSDGQTISARPSRSEETVTVLFTDLEGHTALFEELGTHAAHDLVTEHMGVMRDEVLRWGGAVVKSEGDGLIATFRSVRDAVTCALAIQDWSRSPVRATRRVPIRIAINTGDVIRQDEDVLGLAVIKAARVMSHAAGGEILLAEASRMLLGPDQDLEIASRGWFELKGISQPVQLYEVHARR